MDDEKILVRGKQLIEGYTKKAVDIYNKNSILDKITKTESVDLEYCISDCNDYKQLAYCIRLKMNEFFQIEELSKNIARAELKQVVKTIFSHNEVEEITVKRDSINPGYLETIRDNWDAIWIKQMGLLYGKNQDYQAWNVYTKKEESWGQHPLFEISKGDIKQIENKIVLYDKNYLKWCYGSYYNELTRNNERLYIKFDECTKYPDTFCVELKTVYKLDIDPTPIKIIKLID